MRDSKVTVKDYQYLETVAVSLGFTFLDDFVLL